MYTPTFSLTHRMVKDIVRIELALNEIRKFPLSQSAEQMVILKIGTRNYSDLASLIKVKISENDARDIYLGSSIGTPGSETIVLSNYRSTYDFILASKNDPYMTLSASLFLHLNKLLLNSAVESWEAGRFRSATDEVVSQYDPWIQRTPGIIPTDPHKYFTNVTQWFTDKRLQIHPTIKIACVIRELFEQYPFISGNFVTILAITELLFEKSPLALRGIFPISSHFRSHEQDFLTSLTKCSGVDADLTGWIETYTNAMAIDMTNLKNEVSNSVEKRVHRRRQQLIELNTRQKRIMKYLRYQRKVTRSKYVELTGVSTMTAFRDLEDLVKRKLIVQHGGGRSTYYILAEDDDQKDKLSQPARKIVKVIKDDNVDSDWSGNVSIPFE